MCTSARVRLCGCAVVRMRRCTHVWSCTCAHTHARVLVLEQRTPSSTWRRSHGIDIARSSISGPRMNAARLAPSDQHQRNVWRVCARVHMRVCAHAHRRACAQALMQVCRWGSAAGESPRLRRRMSPTRVLRNVDGARYARPNDAREQNMGHEWTAQSGRKMPKMAWVRPKRASRERSVGWGSSRGTHQHISLSRLEI